jgi:general secretion pathway protein G
MRTRRSRRTAGFTLVELMVVVAIIGLLAAVVTVNVMGQAGEAKKERVKADMKNIATALDLYKLACGKYPDQLEGLWERPGGNEGRKWNGPYLTEGQYPPTDPWGYRYEYQKTGSSYEIITKGAGNAPGGDEEEADLSSKTIFSQGEN